MWKTKFCALGGVRTHNLLRVKHSDFQMISGVSSICQMVSSGCLCREIFSMYFNISLGVVRSLPFVWPLWSSCKTFASNAVGRGFEPRRRHKILFSTFYSIRVEFEELFCKTNIKLWKLFKINFAKNFDTFNWNLIIMYLCARSFIVLLFSWTLLYWCTGRCVPPLSEHRVLHSSALHQCAESWKPELYNF